MNRLLAVLQEEVTQKAGRYDSEKSSWVPEFGNKQGIVIKLVQVESLILRLASKFPGRRDQLLFLINNYDVVRLKHHIIYKREV